MASVTTDPVNNTISDYQARLLANIFRLIPREILYDEDKEKLAPGELGISYKEGCFYVRNPHTGALFSPNSFQHLTTLLSRYDSATNTLNADAVGGITFYTRLTQLDQLPVDYTPDTVIRQMRDPSVFFGLIEYENYKILNWPSDSGMCLIYKVDDTCAMAQYYDYRTYAVYDGRFNHITHKFEGWAAAGSETEFVTSGGTGTNVHIITKELVHDLTVISMLVTETIEPGAAIAVNTMEPLPIVDVNGEPLNAEIEPNNIIMLIYDELNQNWVAFDSTESAILVSLAITNQRFANLQGSTIAQIESARSELAGMIDTRVSGLEKKHDDDIASIRELHEQDIEAVVDKHTRELTELVDQHTRDIAELNETCNTRVAELAAQHASDIEALTAQNTGQVEELKAQYEAEIEELKTQHAADIAALEEQHKKDVNTIVTKYDTWISNYTDEASRTLQEAIDGLSASFDAQLAELKAQPGLIQTVVTFYTCTEDGLYTFDSEVINGYDHTRDKLVITYGQTFLRQDLDYVVDENGEVHFNDIAFVSGDIIQFIVLKQPNYS